jgi:hypothetical protein
MTTENTMTAKEYDALMAVPSESYEANYRLVHAGDAGARLMPLYEATRTLRDLFLGGKVNDTAYVRCIDGRRVAFCCAWLGEIRATNYTREHVSIHGIGARDDERELINECWMPE